MKIIKTALKVTIRGIKTCQLLAIAAAAALELEAQDKLPQKGDLASSCSQSDCYFHGSPCTVGLLGGHQAGDKACCPWALSFQ